MLSHAETPSLLDSPAAEYATPVLRDLPADIERGASGAPIGPYRILREIGHGGMGTVYLAERADQQYQKTVALKLLRAWSVADDRSVRRFLEERQILAALDHPDIARLLDGGVTVDGVPWFAMEYVEGAPIDRYCREHRLTIERRLDLFCRVCAAVQYAHRNLIVHRDLKPANILVTGNGGVKLLDFGIAKLLGDHVGTSAPLTATDERLMTPLYASPEQIRGEPVSTASDVYVLGVLLYELLTGRSPYRFSTREPYEIARAILDQEPEPPSHALDRPGGSKEDKKVARRVRGDLDTIVLTAIQKLPGERYGTAEQLEADVRRHQAGLPLSARPENRFSRARKFVRRHRIGVAITASVGLLVLLFTGVTAVQSARIRAQAGRITLERDRAEQVSQFLAGLFQTSDPYAGAGDSLTAREILDSGAARIDRELADQPEARAQMLFEMGRAYFGLGFRDRARRLVETSLAIRRRSTPMAGIEITRTLDYLGLVLLNQGELEEAERTYREALAARHQLLGARHPGAARSLNGLAAVLRAGGSFHDADSVSRQAIAIDEARIDNNHLDLAESLEGLAQAAQALGDFAVAERLYTRVLALRRQQLPETNPGIASSVINLAAALGNAGQAAAADSLFRYGLALKSRLLGPEHPDLAADEAQYARYLHRHGRDREAETLYRHALHTARQRLSTVHPVTATVLVGMAELLLDQGEPSKAEPVLREALAIRRAALPPGDPGRAEAEQLLGAAALARRHYIDAEAYLLPSAEWLRTTFGPPDPRTRMALDRLVALYTSWGVPQNAAVYRKYLQAARQ